MKKCLYIHDHIFKQKDNYFYSEGKMNNDVFDRYDLFENQITNILCRAESIQNNKDINSKLTKITKKNLHFFPVKGNYFSHVFGNFFIKNIKLIFRLIKSSDFIIVRLPSFLGIFCLIINIFFKKKYFIEFVGSPKEALLMAKSNHTILYKLFVYFFEKLNKYFVYHADGVIYVTQFSLQEKFPSKGFQAIASNVEVNVDTIEPEIEDYKINLEIIKIGLIASYNNEYKGLDIAIKAISILRKKGYNVSLYILGSGKLLNHYTNLSQELGIKEHIHFEGSLAGGDAVLEWLKKLDLYIQPSRTEGLPRALIEAMSVGLPAIASNVGGIPELLSKEYLIKKEDFENLASKIEKLLISKELRFKSGLENWITSQKYDARILKKERQKFWSKSKEIIFQQIS